MTKIVSSLRPQHVLSRSLSSLADAFDLELNGVEPQSALLDSAVAGITMSTADVRPGDIFVGLPGRHVHGARYSSAARDAGAMAVITDEAGLADAEASGLPVLLAADVRQILGELAAWVYRSAEDTPLILGVTGTNGKTSVVYLLAALEEQLGVKSGLSSTAERRIGETAIVSSLTTPEATELHALIACMKESNVEAVAIEVSAQAVTQHRVDGVFFDVVGFTNLSHDHLDDYASFEQYFAAKAELFTMERAGRGVVVIDTPWGAELASRAKIPITTLATESTLATDSTLAADWRATITYETARSTSFILTSPTGERVTVKVPLLGSFMAANAALAIVMLVEAGHALSDITHALDRDDGISVFIPGRAEIVSGPTGPTFYVDYGHTPDAFVSILSSLRRVTTGKVIMLFGADGDRDTTKRASMGAIAARGSDVVVITDFHPRTEDPAAIRAELVAGARGANASSSLFEVADPGEAVRFALSLAGEGDAILYAGPGHENYREVAGAHLDYDARADVRNALRDAGWMESTVNHD